MPLGVKNIGAEGNAVPQGAPRSTTVRRRRAVFLQIHQKATRIFQRFLHADKEGHGAFAIDDPVVIA